MTPVLDTFDRTLASARSTVAFRETLRLAFDSFRASKTRFLLTMLGMVIGSASVILVFTVGSTGKQYAVDTLSSLGTNKVEMQYSGGMVMGPNNVSTPDNMTIEDMDAVDNEVQGIVASSPMLEAEEDISYPNGVDGDQTVVTRVLGVNPQYRNVRNLQILAGRFFDDEDESTHAKVALMVERMAKKLYRTPDAAISRTILVKGIPFTIVGVFKESIDTYGNSEISDNTLLIPYHVARYITGTDLVKEIFFSMQSPDEVQDGAKQITAVIKRRHRPTSEYQAATLTDIINQMKQIADMLTLVLLLASAITLVVSGVGIMNSMLANVQSRVREIGIRKALGATQREILMQFLTESVFLSLGGGVVGTVIGLAIPLSVRFFTDFNIPVSAWSAVVSLVTSVLVGVIFGTLPAQRAAKLDPVATLKYE